MDEGRIFGLLDGVGSGGGAFDVIVDFMNYSTAQFARRWKRMLQATGHYIFLSSSRVFADGGPGLTENAPRLLDACDDSQYLSTDEYALAKARQEDLLNASSMENFTIVRPYITYAKNRLQLGILEKESWLWRAINGLAVPFPEELLDRRTTLTYGGDVALVIRSVLSMVPSGSVYNLALGRSTTWREIVEIYAEGMRENGYRLRLAHCDPSLLIDVYPARRYQLCYDRLYNRVFAEGPGRRLLEQDPTDPSEGLRMCLTEFFKDPVFGPVGARVTGSLNRCTGDGMPRVGWGGRKQLGYLAGRYLPASRGLGLADFGNGGSQS
jgi:hypothetical protein